MEYPINDNGKYVVEGNIKILIEPSTTYWEQRQLEEQQRLEKEVNRDPTDYEIQLQQNIEFDHRLSLIEMGLI